ncbi:MAG: tRNA (adenosine(37)-N6)-dimethylallyltransferase MiaA [Bdellovibrionales bacterium]
MAALSDMTVIGIFGPTSSGKSHLALAMAQKLGAEIVNCDSLQVYQGLDIGTAKPTKKELAMVPHHLISHVPLGEAYAAGQFARDALEILKKRSHVGQKLFFLVGGSGFYAQALIKGTYPVAASDPKKRAELEEEARLKGLATLFEELETRDSQYAKKIGPQDRHRIIRALEILRHEKFQTFSEIEETIASRKPPFSFASVGTFKTRESLRRALDLRTKTMLRQGFIDEVKGLVEQGYHDWSPLQSVGYAEVLEFLDGQIPSEEQLIEAIVTSSMQLAKRQMTWFRRDAETVWFDTDREQEAACQKIEELAKILL